MVDPRINNILESNEKVVWQGVINRKVILFFSIFIFVVAFVIGSLAFTKGIFDYNLMGQSKRISGSTIGIIVILIGLVISLLSYFADKVKEYVITRKRIVIKSGLIGTDFKSIYFDQIKNIIVDVGIIGKIFNTGTIKIDIGKTETFSTGGGYTNRRYSSPQVQTTTMYDYLKHIDNPYGVYKYLQQTLESRKESLYSGRADRESRSRISK